MSLVEQMIQLARNVVEAKCPEGPERDRLYAEMLERMLTAQSAVTVEMVNALDTDVANAQAHATGIHPACRN